HHAAEPGPRPGLLHPRDDVAEPRVGLGGIHAALLVEVLAHASVPLLVSTARRYHAAASARHARNCCCLQRCGPFFRRYRAGNAQEFDLPPYSGPSRPGPLILRGSHAAKLAQAAQTCLRCSHLRMTVRDWHLWHYLLERFSDPTNSARMAALCCPSAGTAP